MCDTLVALGPATKDGISLFAKNSDRPPRECQRLVQLPRRAGGARVRCQYLEILSLCMHAEPLDNTTASMVVALPSDGLVSAWVSLGSPCVGAFLPIYPEASIPPRLGLGGEAPDPASPWWRMRDLLTLVERDFARFGPVVRARWDALEERLVAEAREVEARALAAADGSTVLTAFMEDALDRHLAEAARLVRELTGSP